MPTEKFERLDTSRMVLILSVALDEFARHTYQDASFNRIIRACKMAKGTMYYYFSSKEDLFLTLYKATVREFSQLIRQAQRPVHDSESFWELTTQLLEGLLYLLRQKPSAGLFVTNFLQPGPRLEKHPAAGSIAAIEKWLIAYLLRGQTLGVLRRDLSAAQLAAMIWGLWDSFRPWISGLGGESENDALDAAQLLSLFSNLLSPLKSPSLMVQSGFDLRAEAPSL